MALLNLCNRSVKLVIVRGVVCTIDNDIRSTRNMRCIKLLMFCLLVPKGNNFICGSFQFKVFEASSSSLGVLKKKKTDPVSLALGHARENIPHPDFEKKCSY
jgi:hypothetical protein